MCLCCLCVTIPRTSPSVWPVRRNTSLWRRNPTSLWAWLWQEGGAARAGSYQSLWPASNLMAACPGTEESSEVSAPSEMTVTGPSSARRKTLHQRLQHLLLLPLSFRWRPAEYQRAGLNIPEPQWGCRHPESQRRLALGPAAGARGQHGGRPRSWRAAASHAWQWLWCQLVPIMGHVAGIAQVSPPRKGRMTWVFTMMCCFEPCWTLIWNLGWLVVRMSGEMSYHMFSVHLYGIASKWRSLWDSYCQ